MRIHVNGESRDAASGTTIADLLRQLEVRSDRVAVELNLEVVDRQEFDRRPLAEGDRVEILSFIGGGCQRTWTRRWAMRRPRRDRCTARGECYET